jgi:hypothetical protein
MLSLMLALAASPARGQFDAPAWYVDYEATLKTKHTVPLEDGSGTITWTIDRVFSGAGVLDMRNEGAVLSAGADQSMVMDPDKIKSMSPAEQLKLTQQYLDAMQYTANWMPGPLEGMEDLDALRRHMESVSVPVRINYEKFTKGVTEDELGVKNDYEWRTTATSSSSKIYLGDQFKFEINTSSKKYWLVLPYHGQDMSGTEGVEWVETDRRKQVGTSAWGDEERRTWKGFVEQFLANFMVGDARDRVKVPVIEGTFGGSGTISGEESFAGSILDGPYTVPVTLTYRYTLTTEPPAKK